MEIIIKEGKNKEDIIKEILIENQLEEKDIIFRVESKKGGLFKGEIVVVKAVLISEIQEYTKTFLKELLTNMGLEVKFESRIRDGGITVKMYSDKNNILIGKNGQTLAALQTIIRQVIFNKIGAYPYIILDVENYKDKQIMHLERLAKNIAREVASSGVETKLENMNAYERRIVHSILSENKKVYTTSEGEEPNRHVVIKPKKD